MKTLALVGGDLVLGANGHATVEGLQKTVQDLGVALREEYGVDRFHPHWGSLLTSMVGEPIGLDTRQRVQSEVRRVVSSYMAVQREMVAKRTGTRANASELLAEVEDIKVTYRDFTRFDVTIMLRTMDRRRVALSTTVEG